MNLVILTKSVFFLWYQIEGACMCFKTLMIQNRNFKDIPLWSLITEISLQQKQINKRLM